MRILINHFKNVLYRPRLVRMGVGSVILLPRWIRNPSYIEVGKACSIGRSSVLYPITKYGGQLFTPRIVIKDNVYVGGYCQIHSINSVILEDGCVLSEYVYISDVAHGLNPENGLIMDQALESKGPVHIGAHTFIGYGVSILPGVTLGKHCVVGTRSIVTHSFPDYSMIGGSPAKLLKKYCFETHDWVKV